MRTRSWEPCLQKGIRGKATIEARQTMMNDSTKLDGLWPGDRYHGGLTVLSCNAMPGNCGNSPYSHHSSFFTNLNNQHCD